MLRIQNLSHTYERPIFKAANFHLKKNEIVGIVGKSGAGKSTLLNILAGKIQADEGNIFFNGERMPEVKDLLIPGYKNIAIVNQDFKLDEYHTVEENIREAILSVPFQKREMRVKKLLKLFGLHPIAQVKASLISGGEKQRLAIARAIVHSPDVLLLDEPFGNLDTHLKTKLSELLVQLSNDQKMPIVLVSHDPHDIFGLCDYVCFLRNRKISRKYDPRSLYYNLRNLPLARLFGPVNEVNFQGVNYRFRPDEYLLDTKNSKLPVKFVKFVFYSGFYHCYFECEGNLLLLYANESLEKVTHIEVNNKLVL
jgi:ABC-type multidrug transport system ATPase subunit